MFSQPVDTKQYNGERKMISNVCVAGFKLSLRTGIRLRHILQLVLFLTSCLLVACSSQPPFMAKIFDIPPPGQPDPGHAPVIHSPRRTLFVDPRIEEAKMFIAMREQQLKAPPPVKWAEVFKKLPKDDDENINWMVALNEKVIKPRAGIDPNTPDGKTLDADVELSTSGKPERMVVFSHAIHTQWLACANCHPAIFQEKAGMDKITMSENDDGKYCGTCHDRVAITEPNDCHGCHKVVIKKS
jgi:c(7)-type cytochrome triheme protein